MQVFCKKNVNSARIYTIFRRKAWLYSERMKKFFCKKMHIEEKVALLHRQKE